MTTRLVVALLLLQAVPASAVAQTSLASPVPATAAAEQAAEVASFTFFLRTRATQQRARDAMLGALTPEHRALLAQLIGSLAVTPEPNYDAVAARLDSVLFQTERRSILRIATLRREQFETDLDHLQSFMPPMTAEQVKQSRDQGTDYERAMVRETALEGDPGHVLLRAALSGLHTSNGLFKTQGR